MNRSSIGRRITVSFLLVIILMIVVVYFGFSRIIMNTLVNQTKEELATEVQRTLNLIKNTSTEDSDSIQRVLRSNENRPLRMLQISTRFMDVEYAIIASNGKIAVKSDNNITADFLNRIVADESDSDEYIFIKKPLKINTQSYDIIFYGKMSEVAEIQGQFTAIMLVAVSIAGVAGLIMLVFVQGRLLRPLNKLGNAMESYEIGGNVDIEHHHNDEIGALTNSFKELTQALNNTKERQDIFFQNASHELKTPLMSIQGYAEAIMDGVVTGDEVNESLQIITFESQRLKHIVEEMIYLTHLEEGEISFDPELVPLSQVVDQSVKSVLPLYQNANIELDVKGDLDIMVKLDVKRTIQVLVNILGNNVRYAEEKVLMRCAKKEDFLYFDIIDDGPGFSSEDVSMIFDRFYKGKKGKHGIGLSIAKTIVESQGGSIQADNHIDGGAIFRIKLFLGS